MFCADSLWTLLQVERIRSQVGEIHVFSTTGCFTLGVDTRYIYFTCPETGEAHVFSQSNRTLSRQGSVVDWSLDFIWHWKYKQITWHYCIMSEGGQDKSTLHIHSRQQFTYTQTHSVYTPVLAHIEYEYIQKQLSLVYLTRYRSSISSEIQFINIQPD